MNQRNVILLIGAMLLLIILSIFFLFRQNLIGSINTQQGREDQKKEATNTTSYSTPTGPLLKTGSLIKEYDMKLLNEQVVIAKLKELNIFGREYLYTDTQTTGSKPLNAIFILLTNDPRNYEKFYSNNSYVVLFNGIVQIYFNLDDNALSDPNIKDTILEESIGVLYTLRYPDVEKGKAKDFVQQVVKELKDDDASMVITKK